MLRNLKILDDVRVLCKAENTNCHSFSPVQNEQSLEIGLEHMIQYTYGLFSNHKKL